MNSFLLAQLQKYVMLFDTTTDQLMAWVGDWKEQVPELYHPNFQIFSVYAFWGAGIYLLWANKKQMLNPEEKDRLEELERIFLRAETKAEIATHLFPEKVTSELDSFFSRVAKWWQGEYNRKLNQLKAEDKKSELKLAVAYIFYRREQMFFATLAIERQCLRGTAKLAADLKSMNEFLVDPAIKLLCQEHQNLFKGNASDLWFPEEFWWRKMCPFQEDSISLSVSIEKKTARKESWLDFLDENGGGIMKEELWKKLYERALKLQKIIDPDNEEEWSKAKKIAEMALVVAEETFETDSPELEHSSLLVKSFEATTRINPAAPSTAKPVKVPSPATPAPAVAKKAQPTPVMENDANAWNNKGAALSKLGKYSKALDCFFNAIKINPNNQEAMRFIDLTRDKLSQQKKFRRNIRSFFFFLILIIVSAVELWFMITSFPTSSLEGKIGFLIFSSLAASIILFIVVYLIRGGYKE